MNKYKYYKTEQIQELENWSIFMKKKKILGKIKDNINKRRSIFLSKSTRKCIMEDFCSKITLFVSLHFIIYKISTIFHFSEKC